MLEVQANSLSSQIYAKLRQQLMSARLRPGNRLKVRDVAALSGTSETPVREALIQLVKDGALEMKPGHYFRVRRVSLVEYMELRDIRLLLEPHAAVKAIPHIDSSFLAHLEVVHEKLVDAERTKDYPAALQYNYDFHFGVYRRSDMPQLIEILERLWVQVGPMLSFLYPDASPQYDGVHQHLNVIKALKRKNEVAVRKAFEQDLIEGGRNFIRHLSEIEAKEAGNHHSFSKKNPKP